MTSRTPSILDILDRLDQIAASLDQPEQRYFSVKSAAAYTGHSEASIRRLLESGKIRRLRLVPGSIRLDRQEIDDYLASTADDSLVGGRGTWLKTKNAARGSLRTPHTANGESLHEHCSK